MSEAIRTPATVKEIVKAFDEEAETVDLGRYAVEDWVTLAVFWSMAACVFLQFFTRYVLNNSLAWTEEVATNCLIVTVFLGSAMCVRLSSHIRVDFIYRFLSTRIGRSLALLVDLSVIVFFAYATWLFWRYIAIVGHERMVTVDLPRGFVFYSVFAAFALMLFRAARVFFGDVRRATTPSHPLNGV